MRADDLQLIFPTHRRPDAGAPGAPSKSWRPPGVDPSLPYEPVRHMTNPFPRRLTNVGLSALDRIPGYQRQMGRISHAISKHRGYAQPLPAPPKVQDDPGSWKFAVLGDFGAGTPEQARVAANILRSDAELVVTTGDNVYPTGAERNWARHFDPPQFGGDLVRTRPMLPTIGNHDIYSGDLRPYFKRFPHLKGNPYYSAVKGAAQLFMLDTEQDLRPGSAQHTWLDQELAKSKSTWRILAMHYPSYGSGPEGFEGVRDSLDPLIARHGVQLVLAGHEHSYSRSKPINGAVHITTGGGGGQTWAFQVPQRDTIALRHAGFHHLEVSVGEQNLVVRAIDQHGKVFDATTIPATGATQAQQGAELLPTAA